MSAFTSKQRLRFSTKYGIVLAGGISPSGQKFYAYIKADQDSIKRMNGDFNDGKVVDFRQYGEIINYGPGEEPPESVRYRIAKKYGFAENEEEFGLAGEE